MSNQSEAASVLCKPIGAKLWPISEHRENRNSLSDCYLNISKYHLAHRRPNTRFCGACRTYANFFTWYRFLRRFRIIRCKRQAVLHSAVFNYTPLVIGGTDKNKQLTIIKPIQTGINRNKWTFCTIKSLEPLKKIKHQPRPLVRPSSVNFCQNLFNLSHERVPLIQDYGSADLASEGNFYGSRKKGKKNNDMVKIRKRLTFYFILTG
jgi:hypothetical protein